MSAGARILPDTLPGHWDTAPGRAMAQEYVTRSRADLAHGDLSDLALANAVYLADRWSLDLLAKQTAAKERIRWLSVQLALREMEILKLRGALTSDGSPTPDIMEFAAARLVACSDKGTGDCDLTDYVQALRREAAKQRAALAAQP